MVLAGGCVADTNADSELLWALHGAGAGTLGIVTELRGKVYPVPNLYGGFLAFPLAEAATVIDTIEKPLDDDFPDEFSGDAIVVNPDMAPTPGAEPCFVLFWCWTLVNDDLAPAKRLLEQAMQAGRVLGNTVTGTTPTAYGLGDSSLGTFFRSRNVDRINQNVGTILARNPHRIHCPLSSFTIIMGRGFDMKSEILSGRPFRIDTNMSSSDSMVALG
ncbi:hypothetical protein BDV25DRAFT_137948 [Aspergillus avenaceus]|uniref:FAD-binding PCMH-type domain-containing protein n=1 Tax=Aspergillus avenaceus TaxID=36643 RepID=A0A5N6U199_ASPAV|nr:hypothetical protein BDV25DRAFT_137948 [Aspergillus avenaceus]